MKLFCAPHKNNGHGTVYALLKYAYIEMYGENPPEIGKSENGKPYFIGNDDVHFSLSHCKTHVLCGLSACPIGVDIESPRKINKRSEKFFCLPDEQLLFQPLELWILKESYIKLIDGILPMMKTIKFSRQNDKIAAPDEKVISKLYSIDSCRAAVSSLYAPPPDTIDYVPFLAL